MTSNALFAKFSCTNCQDDILGVTVHCSECEDFPLCPQCFAAGAELGTHKSDHSYYFTDATVVNEKKNVWTDREKLRLLEGIDIYSFGNWNEISKYIGTRSAKESKEEYINKYLNGAIGRHTLMLETKYRPQLADHTVDDKDLFSQPPTQSLLPIDVKPKQAIELLYMPKRNDFGIEYDPSAEQLVSTLTICPTDDDADIAIKLAQVDIYKRRLRERTHRNRLVVDHQLIPKFFREKARRQQTKNEQGFREQFRKFSQFFAAMEFEHRIASFEREKALRVRLSELCRYRSNGLQTMEEGVHFQMHSASIERRTDNQVNGDRQLMQQQSPAFNLNTSVCLLQEPSIHLLSANEIQLCSKLNIPATHYLTIKTMLLSGASYQVKSIAETYIKNYLIQAGWLCQANACYV